MATSSSNKEKIRRAPLFIDELQSVDSRTGLVPVLLLANRHSYQNRIADIHTFYVTDRTFENRRGADRCRRTSGRLANDVIPGYDATILDSGNGIFFG